MVKAEGDSWWLGLHTFENDGRFRWSDHSVLNYVSWALGRPLPLSRDRRCVHVSASKGRSSQKESLPEARTAYRSCVYLRTGDWADQKCHSDLPYICKRVNVTGTIPPTPSAPHPPAGCPDKWSSFQHKVRRQVLKVFQEGQAFILISVLCVVLQGV